MRLLEYKTDGEFSLTTDFGGETPPYAIFSHTWEAEEVTFKDLVDGTGKGKAGHRKIQFCGEQARCGEMDAPCKSYIQKLANAAENAFADRAILLDENLLLLEQNNEKTTRKSMRATIVGSARVMSYEDIVEAQKQRDIKEATAEAGRGRRSKRNILTQVPGKRSRGQELEEAEHKIKALRMEEYCSVLDF